MRLEARLLTLEEQLKIAKEVRKCKDLEMNVIGGESFLLCV